MTEKSISYHFTQATKASCKFICQKYFIVAQHAHSQASYMWLLFFYFVCIFCDSRTQYTRKESKVINTWTTAYGCDVCFYICCVFFDWARWPRRRMLCYICALYICVLQMCSVYVTVSMKHRLLYETGLCSTHVYSRCFLLVKQQLQHIYISNIAVVISLQKIQYIICDSAHIFRWSLVLQR